MATEHKHVSALPGESAPFHFESRWKFDRPMGTMWPALLSVDDWPLWWPGVEATTTDGSGVRNALTVSSPIGLRLSFHLELVDLIDRVRISFSADGDLRGHGELTVLGLGPCQSSSTTQLAITWCVVTHRNSLRMFRPFAHAAHDRVMAAGKAGLTDWLSR